jgi:hypothetical protein
MATSQRLSRGFHRLALFLAAIPLLVGTGIVAPRTSRKATTDVSITKRWPRSDPLLHKGLRGSCEAALPFALPLHSRKVIQQRFPPSFISCDAS